MQTNSVETSSDTQSFVVRIGHEELDEQDHIVAWRGLANHTGNNERFHFDNLDRLAQSIQEQVGLAYRWSQRLAQARGVR